MNTNKGGFPIGGRFSLKQFWQTSVLALLCALLTGCPHNDYTVEMKPTLGGVERTLSFYRTDDYNTNGLPCYQEFPPNELTAISKTFPAGAVKREGNRFVAKGEFAGPLPRDLGGCGSCSNLTTSLGMAGFYLERFRGEDNLVGRMEKQFRAADQITDLFMGWTQAEFGRERGYKKLRHFLDADFRRDLKNAGMYFCAGEISTLSNSNAPEEFVARFSQYLYERDYVKLSDLPELSTVLSDNSTEAEGVILRWIRRLVTEKMGLETSAPLPQSMSVLSNPVALNQSWTNYLTQTDLYRAKIKTWERKRKTEPDLKKPEPLDLPGDFLEDLMPPLKSFGGEPDHLTVKLALPRKPNHTNGKWREGQVVWEVSLEGNRVLPVLCYASWSNPNDEFQIAHFGRVLLNGDELTQYCLWQNGLGGEQACVWENFLAGLNPGQELDKRLKDFQLPVKPLEGENGSGPNPFAVGCKLLIEAVKRAESGSHSNQP